MATLKYRKSDGTYAAIPVIQGPVGPKGDKGDKGDNYGDGVYLPLAGGTVTGSLMVNGPSKTNSAFRIYNNSYPQIELGNGSGQTLGLIFMDTQQGAYSNMYFRVHSAASAYGSVHITSAGALYGAVWNDYAEFRETKQFVKPGHVVFENGDDTLSQSYKRMLPACSIVSDTFGFAIGETEKCKTPLAMAGRVLAYPNEDRNSYKPGDAVCSGPHGTVSKMTQDEKITHPECIIGYVSCVPDYETWGEKDTKVDGRIWIKVV